MNNDDNKEKISFRDKMKDKKYNAKVQLLGYGIFILIVIVYANVSSKNYNYNSINNTLNKTNTTTSSTNTNKSLLDTINNNYDYNIDINIKSLTDTTETDNTYNYKGTSYKDIISIIYLDKTYFYENNEYYLDENDSNIIVNEKDIYPDVEYKYISINQIINYINKSSLDHTTNYSTGVVSSTYYLYLKDIITNYLESDYVQIDVKEENDTITIDIDYTNLIKYKDNNINSYKVTATINNINKVEGFNIETSANN